MQQLQTFLPYLRVQGGHARYIADLVGAAHLCIGTDINGVPGMMAGFRRENDVRLIAEYLMSAGFSADDLAGIMGGNFMRVLEHAAPRR